eukprot:1942314-Amphidinium_carterae.1
MATEHGEFSNCNAVATFNINHIAWFGLAGGTRNYVTSATLDCSTTQYSVASTCIIDNGEMRVVAAYIPRE